MIADNKRDIVYIKEKENNIKKKTEYETVM